MIILTAVLIFKVMEVPRLQQHEFLKWEVIDS